tara:strand:- start:35 stop:391 length:357 start_codon:yes stop_codon:yes gene_type:complete
VSALPAFPAASVNATLKVTAPSASPLPAVYTEVQAFPLFEVATLLEVISVPPLVNVIVAAESVSLAVKVTVTVLLTIAKVLAALLEIILTLVSVGKIFSAKLAVLLDCTAVAGLSAPS